MGGLGYISASDLRRSAWAASWAATWGRIKELVPALAGVAPSSSPTPSLVELREALAVIKATHDGVAADHEALDATLVHVDSQGDKHFQFHPGDLPKSDELVSIDDVAEGAQEPRMLKAQRALTAGIHHRRWLDLANDARLHSRRAAAHFLSVSQPHAGAFLSAIPSSPDMRLSSDEFALILQRRLALPVSAQSNLTYSPSLRRPIDPLADSLQNDHEHGCRHNKVLRKWVNVLKSAFGAAAVRMEPKASAVYSPGVIPDCVAFKAKDGKHHRLFELKISSPLSAGEAGTAEIGGRAAFGNTESQHKSDVLGRPASGDDPATLGAYSGALTRGHSVTPIIHESFGGFAPDACKLLDECVKKHGKRFGSDSEVATWATRNFRAMCAQRISVALHLACAAEILGNIERDVALVNKQAEA